MPRRPPIELATIEPMLPMVSKLLPRSGSWHHEFKLDGYHVLAAREALRTKGGVDATTWFPEITASLTGLPTGHHIIDAEVCVLVDGRSDFEQLHKRALRRRWYPGAPPVVLCAFDLLVHAGVDIRGKPIEERKARLAKLVEGLPSVLYVSAIDDGAAAWSAVLAWQLEGLVAKRAGSVYVAGPSRDWLKIKRPGATFRGFKRDF
ncbi:hypothetical protein GA566_31735 [Cupriavidus sp. SW-Y-13]|uniref:Uncharacterized protein n=3 Tax=Cupriavidus TaxID=106589 RepID=A0A2L0XDJ6_9BURK|nr:hypothetical protein C3Z06_30775 [Cupriavidus metallidurans]MWL91960.1 hypothetical protein [Cupriavidus sp. SW-Y-13]QBP14530.1 hypothetical protein DDF84_033050 [Cupriavidus metallidurans]